MIIVNLVLRRFDSDDGGIDVIAHFSNPDPTPLGRSDYADPYYYRHQKRYDVGVVFPSLTTDLVEAGVPFITDPLQLLPLESVVAAFETVATLRVLRFSSVLLLA